LPVGITVLREITPIKTFNFRIKSGICKTYIGPMKSQKWIKSETFLQKKTPDISEDVRQQTDNR
jgi:hypothetical protein